ncbi:hypothetical protein WUBG_01182 [Wuchereria bancrofti]|uniref:Uncharacterized protein n=1 Tax=Wuchereria bancrofti TaxID=6293 RepID=J9F092_WUCBA|nr:hypothetical protein WUBG_01182 [Wuchereria bancrofti]
MIPLCETATNSDIYFYGFSSNASTGNNADLLSNTTQTVNLRTSSNQQILQQVIAREIRALSQQLDEQQKKRPRSIHLNLRKIFKKASANRLCIFACLKSTKFNEEVFPKVKSRSALNNFGYFPIVNMAESDDSN